MELELGQGLLPGAALRPSARQPVQAPMLVQTEAWGQGSGKPRPGCGSQERKGVRDQSQGGWSRCAGHRDGSGGQQSGAQVGPEGWGTASAPWHILLGPFLQHADSISVLASWKKTAPFLRVHEESNSDPHSDAF